MSDGSTVLVAVVAAILGSGGLVAAVVTWLRFRKKDTADVQDAEASARLKMAELAQRLTDVATRAEERTSEVEERLGKRIATLAMMLSECEEDRVLIKPLRAEISQLKTESAQLRGRVKDLEVAGRAST